MTSIDTQLETIFAAERTGPSLQALAMELPARLDRLLTLLLDWQDRARERRQLLGLSDAALKDFAASRADAEGAGGGRCWRA